MSRGMASSSLSLSTLGPLLAAEVARRKTAPARREAEPPVCAGPHDDDTRADTATTTSSSEDVHEVVAEHAEHELDDGTCVDTTLGVSLPFVWVLESVS